MMIETGTDPEEIRLEETRRFASIEEYDKHTPVGRFERLKIQHVSFVADELVLATDGALFGYSAQNNGSTPHTPVDPEAWVKSLREWEASSVSVRHSRIKKIDDAALAHVRPSLRH